VVKTLRAEIQVADEKNTAVDVDMLLALRNDDKQLEMHVMHWGTGMERRISGSLEYHKRKSDQLRTLNSSFANHL